MNKNIIASLLMAVSFVATAAPVAITTRDTESVILFDEQKHCEEGRLYAEYFDGRVTHKGCWALARGGSIIHIKYDDGDQGGIPVQMFRKPSTT